MVSSLDRQHDEVRTGLKMPTDFVIHSLRHTMLTRLGEAGADNFSIMKIAGHGSVTVSQRYVHPTPGGMDRAFDRLESLNAEKFQQAEAEAKETIGGVGGPCKNRHRRRTPLRKTSASSCF
jgi:site-specific recombinase XerC